MSNKPIGMGEQNQAKREKIENKLMRSLAVVVRPGSVWQA